MKEFALYEPTSLKEACALLAQHGDQAKALAGGTDLLVGMKAGWLRPEVVVNLKKIDGLRDISFSERRGLSIGALVTWTQILEHPQVAEHYPALHQAAASMGSYQVRNLGTLAGNLCHASPAANGPVPLLIYEASCLIQGPRSKRTLDLSGLFAGPQKNALAPGELLSEIFLPVPPAGSKSLYLKFAQRKAMELATVAVGSLVQVKKDKFKLVRLALGAVGPVPFRAHKAEKVLLDQAASEEIMRRAAQVAMEESAPISDLRASAEYRRGLLEELTYRALRDCLA
ncbi:MAG: xanthine dehydrogenase family protein subunit M [Desulfarculus sp.]|jgi:carbon-monoxide dehydrogenase medium subunit|nr:MAG: xanthine dehydrogenase family protein subunit M [Desulfarculus sp.]